MGFGTVRDGTNRNAGIKGQFLEVTFRAIDQVPIANPFHVGPRGIVRREVEDIK